jgi:hypothetical protein
MIFVPKSGELAYRRGRQVCIDIGEAVREHQLAGRHVEEVRISKNVGADMRVFYTQAAQAFDNVLPKRILGVPLIEGETDGKDVVIRVGDHSTC